VGPLERGHNRQHHGHQHQALDLGSQPQLQHVRPTTSYLAARQTSQQCDTHLQPDGSETACYCPQEAAIQTDRSRQAFAGVRESSPMENLNRTFLIQRRQIGMCCARSITNSGDAITRRDHGKHRGATGWLSKSFYLRSDMSH